MVTYEALFQLLGVIIMAVTLFYNIKKQEIVSQKETLPPR